MPSLLAVDEHIDGVTSAAPPGAGRLLPRATSRARAEIEARDRRADMPRSPAAGQPAKAPSARNQASK